MAGFHRSWTACAAPGGATGGRSDPKVGMAPRRPSWTAPDAPGGAIAIRRRGGLLCAPRRRTVPRLLAIIRRVGRAAVLRSGSAAARRRAPDSAPRLRRRDRFDFAYAVFASIDLHGREAFVRTLPAMNRVT